MKLILQSVLYGCLLATVTHSMEFEMSPELKKRLSMWMQSRSRRDLSSLSTESRAESGHFVRPQDVRDSLIPHSSTHTSVRTKRSKTNVNQSRRPGCSLGTCTVHDLAHRIHQLNNKLKISSAPIEKISPQGYGRRRRSLPERQATLQLEQGQLRAVWIPSRRSRVHKLEALLKRT
ncbi:adrenomedullin a [Aplochiton taeniatus]